MDRISKIALVTVCFVAALPATASAAKPSADYRFEDSFTSSVNGADALNAVGPPRMCPPCEKFTKVKVNGKRQGVWKWPFQDGLRLRHADKLLGHGGKTYTIVMLVALDEVGGYRKLVDFNDRKSEEGWYQYGGSLFPYDLGDFETSQTPIDAGKWVQIALTRDGQGVVHGYVDGTQIDKAKDKDKDIALSKKDTLHFLIDDDGPNTETSGGMIARLRIWENALDKRDIKHLGD